MVTTTANQITVTGTGVPILAWAPLAHDFGVLNTGTNSSAQTFTLSNTGNLAASGCSAPTISDTTNFTITSDTCSTNNLAAVSGSCSVSVRANTATQGLKSATLSRSCSVGGITSTTANQITVTGAASAMTWLPLTHSFGNVGMGEFSAVEWFSLTDHDVSGAPISGCSAPVLSDPVNFQIVTDNCGTNSFPAFYISGNADDGFYDEFGICNIQVRARPQSLGSKTLTISRTCTSPTNLIAMTTTNQITATGVTPVSPTITWSPSMGGHSFTNTAVGSTSISRNFILTNGSPFHAESCSAPVLSNAVDFEMTDVDCGTNDLPVTQSCTVTVRARPQSTGYKNTSISRNCSNYGTLTTSTSVFGLLAGPVLFWSDQEGPITLGQTLNLGTATVGTETAPYLVELHNGGGAAATGCGLPTLSNPTDFGFVSDTCGLLDLLPGNFCEVSVKANPASTGLKATTLSRTCSVGGVITTLTDQITATGTAGVAANWVQDFGFASFGSVRSAGGESSSLKYSFRNQTTTPLTGCGIASVSNADFSIVSQTCGNGAMTAFSLCEVQVKANPITVGAKTANLTRTCNETGAVTVALSVQGEDATEEVLHVSTGDTHSCALLSSGKIKCWGYNTINGRLGDGTDDDKKIPVYVSNISTAVQVDVGNYHTCALLSSGQVQCWGNDGLNYMLGDDGDDLDKSTPVNVAGVTTAVHIAVGRNHSCAALADGTAKCWGDNTSYQIGDNIVQGYRPPSTVLTPVFTPLTNVIQVGVGDAHSCALIDDGVLNDGVGSIRCWGEGSFGRLGTGSSTDQYTSVSVLNISTAVQLAIGDLHSCARLSNNTVQCWGYDGYGQLGDNAGLVNKTSPVPVDGITTAINIAAGTDSTCAVLTGGILKCWGENSLGKLGNGTYTDSGVPVSSTLAGVSQVTVGDDSSCALLTNKSVKCWGSGEPINDTYGREIFNQKLNVLSTPAAVPGISTAVQVVMGYRHTCALLDDGGTPGGPVKCWGDNTNRQYGNNTTVSLPGTFDVTGITNAVQISAGRWHTCARLSNGDVKCWGYNGNGELGDGTASVRSTPVTVVGGVANVTQISAGNNHTCARMSNSTMKCWGYSGYYQIGNGDNVDVRTPVSPQDINVGGEIASVIHIAAGQTHTCAVLSNNTIKCWGGGANGNGDQNKVLGITQAFGNLYLAASYPVTGISNAVRVYAGSEFNCALLSDGTVKCWGEDDYRKLGTGANGATDIPALVVGLDPGTVLELSLTTHTTCALLTDSRVKCWGLNDVGQLGNGSHRGNLSYGDSTAQFRLSSNSTSFVGAGANAKHMCSVQSGQVFCSGKNDYMQSGQSIFEFRHISGL